MADAIEKELSWRLLWSDKYVKIRLFKPTIIKTWRPLRSAVRFHLLVIVFGFVYKITFGGHTCLLRSKISISQRNITTFFEEHQPISNQEGLGFKSWAWSVTNLHSSMRFLEFTNAIQVLDETPKMLRQRNWKGTFRAKPLSAHGLVLWTPGILKIESGCLQDWSYNSYVGCRLNHRQSVMPLKIELDFSKRFI